MRGMKIHRLSVAVAEPILHAMEKIQFPSHSELYSLEMRARSERSREMGRLLVRGAAAVAAALQHLFSHEPKGVRHA
jgi:hypothetical protein